MWRLRKKATFHYRRPPVAEQGERGRGGKGYTVFPWRKKGGRRRRRAASKEVDHVAAAIGKRKEVPGIFTKEK